MNLLLKVTEISTVADSIQQMMPIVDQFPEAVSLMKTVTAITAIISPFIFSLVVIYFILYYKSKQNKLRSQERIKMIEKGMIPPAEQIKKNPIIIQNNKPIAPWAKLGLGFGIGLFAGAILEKIGFDDTAAYWSMIFIGISVMWIFGDRILGFHKNNHHEILNKKDNPTVAKNIDTTKKSAKKKS